MANDMGIFILVSTGMLGTMVNHNYVFSLPLRIK
ncbi:uncharacterized protein METZ01_LOCUS370529 [marine metagenome]|uniref:Uncharacterized protein n=1 Tax=marine metagenome TaxID=408172 RepID=A0A382T7C9_9ZZZZ